MLGEAYELVSHFIVELSRIGIKTRLRVLQDQGVSEWKWRMGDVMAANVEDPGHRMRIANEQSILCRESSRHAGKFFFGVLSGEFARMQGYFAKRRRRAIYPNRVDRVWLNGNEFSPPALVPP